MGADGWPVGRLGPYDDLAWIAQAWLPLVRGAIVNGASTLAEESEATADRVLLALSPPSASNLAKSDNILPAR